MSDYVISTRIDRIKLQQSTLQIKHDIRTRIPKEYDLRRSASHQNKMMDSSIVFSALTANDEEMMKKHRNQMIDSIKDDYQKTKGKSIPSNTTFTISGVVTFGVSDTKKRQRPSHLKDLDEVTDYEADDINSFDLDKKDEAVKEYMKKLEETYGTKVLYCVRHSDEKVDHYHFQILNYDFVNHKTMLSNLSKMDMMKMGENLQDMCGESFSSHTDGYFGRGAKREKKSKHKDIKTMHDAELKESKIKIQREREIRLNLDKENQATTRKYQMMKNDLDDYDRQKSIKQKEIDRLQEMKKKLEDEKIDEKYQKLQKITSMVENKKSTLERLDEKVTTATVVAKQINTDLKEKLSNVVRPRRAVEIGGMFGKKMVDAPAGYVLYSIEDAKKITAVQVQINDFEKQNDCSFNDIMIKQKDIESKSKKLTEDNEKLKQREYELREKHQNELETLTKKFQKQVDEKMKEMKNFYEIQISELQNTVDDYKDKMKDFYLKLKDKFSITKEKFDATEMNDRKIGDYNARNR